MNVNTTTTDRFHSGKAFLATIWTIVVFLIGLYIGYGRGFEGLGMPDFGSAWSLVTGLIALAVLGLIFWLANTNWRPKFSRNAALGLAILLALFAADPIKSAIGGLANGDVIALIIGVVLTVAFVVAVSAKRWPAWTRRLPWRRHRPGTVVDETIDHHTVVDGGATNSPTTTGVS